MLRRGPSSTRKRFPGAGWLLGLVLSTGIVPGCASITSPFGSAVSRYSACAPDCTWQGRDHVYVYLLNGFSFLPHQYGSMRSIARELRNQGYAHVEVGNQYHRWLFERTMIEAQHADPQARFVLIGYSIGSGVVHSLANAVLQQGIVIDSIVYIDAEPFVANFNETPNNVARVVNIYSADPLLHGEPVPGAWNLRVGDAWHNDVPHHPDTVRVLFQTAADAATSATVSDVTARTVGTARP